MTALIAQIVATNTNAVLTASPAVKSLWISLNPTVVTAWAAIAAVLVAIWAINRDNARSRFATMIDLLTRQDDLLNKDEHTLASRKKAAMEILEGKTSPHLTDVLNHFEFIGLLVRRGAIDKEMAWSTFYSVAVGWWQVASDHIKENRKEDQTVWCDYEYLVNTLMAIETNKTGKTNSGLQMTEKQKKEFLDHEKIVTIK
jgi:hypothetical protein